MENRSDIDGARGQNEKLETKIINAINRLLMSKEDRVRFGEIILRSRKRLGLSQKLLGEIIGYGSYMEIRRLENGQKKRLQYEKVEKLAKALELPIELLTTGEGQASLLQNLLVSKAKGITDEDERARIGQIIRLRRKSLGLTLSALAEKIKIIGPQTVHDYEFGIYPSFRYPVLEAMSEALGLPIEKLITKEGQTELLQQLESEEATLKIWGITDDEARARIGQIIRLKRKSLGLTQKKLGETLKTIGYQTIGDYELGNPLVFRYSVLEVMSEALGIPIEKLITKEGQVELLQQLKSEEVTSKFYEITDEDQKSRIGQIFGLKRKSLGLTFLALAEKTPSISGQTIRLYEIGGIKALQSPVLEEICNALGLPIELLRIKEGQIELLKSIESQAELPKQPISSPESKLGGISDEEERTRIGKILRLKRQSLGLSQSDIAAKTKAMGYQTIGLYEVGSIKKLPYPRLEELSQVLGLPMEKLITKEGQSELLRQLESEYRLVIEGITDKDHKARIGQILRIKRLLLGLSQSSLVEKVKGTNKPAIGKYETGSTKKIKYPVLEELSQALGLPIEKLITEEGQIELLRQFKSEHSHLIAGGTSVSEITQIRRALKIQREKLGLPSRRTPAEKNSITDEGERARISQIIKRKRNMLGLSQRVLVKSIPTVSQQSLAMIETIKVNTIQYWRLEELAKALDLPYEKLITKEGQEELLVQADEWPLSTTATGRTIGKSQWLEVDWANTPIRQTSIQRDSEIDTYNIEKYPNCRYILQNGKPLYYMRDITMLTEGIGRKQWVKKLIQMDLISPMDVGSSMGHEIREEFVGAALTTPLMFGTEKWLEIYILKSLSKIRRHSGDIDFIPEAHRRIYEEILGKDIETAPRFEELVPPEYDDTTLILQNKRDAPISQIVKKSRHRKYNEEIGKRLKEARESRGISRLLLRRKMRWTSEVLLSSYEKGTAPDVSINKLIDISEALDVSLLYLLGIREAVVYSEVSSGEDGSKIAETKRGIPILNRVPPDLDRLTDELIIGYDEVSDKSVSFGLKVKDDSMEGARIHEGDVVLIEKRSGKLLQNGEILLVQVKDEDGILRRYYRYGTDVTLKPENLKMKETSHHISEVKVLGKVKEVKFKI